MIALRRAVWIALLAPLPLSAQQRFTLDDVAKLVRLSEPQISPDGRGIAFIAERADYDSNRWNAQLILLDVASGAQRVLVQGRDVSNLRWSPSGDRIAFLSSVDDLQQVHVLAVAGGGGGAGPQVRTRAARGVRQFAWRPDGGAIAYIARDTTPSPAERHNDAFVIGNDPYTISAAPVPSHLWVDDRRLTNGEWSLATSLSTSTLSWSADGRTIAVVRFATPHSGDTDQSTIWLVDAGSGATRALTDRTSRESAGYFSPGGSWIAYSYPRDGDPANLEEIHVAPASGRPAVAAGPVTRGLDRHVTEFVWMPDEKSLAVLGTDGTRSALWVVTISGQTWMKVPLGSLASVAEISVSSTGAMAFVGSEVGRPPEIYHIASPSQVLPPSDPPRRLTDFHAEIAGRALGRAEPVEWNTHDGLRADGVLTLPPGFSARTRYPLVLLIHGGPTASSTEDFYSRVQLLAAQGWLVFQPNYRGSDNRGNAFQRAIAASAAEGPGRDIMAGVATLIRRGIVDTTRIAVSGWSYGGYLTAWLLGRYPERWRAAVAGAAPVSLLDMYDFSDLNVMRRHAITTSPWVGNRLAAWLAESPLTHVSKIRAPTLIMSNTGDARVAITGSYVLYHALKDNNVPVQFIGYPGPGHSPWDPVRQRDVNRRWIEWLAGHLR